MTLSIYPSGGSQNIGAVSLYGTNIRLTEPIRQIPVYETSPDYQPYDQDLDSLADATGVGQLYYRSSNNVWSPLTIGPGLALTSGTLDIA